MVGKKRERAAFYVDGSNWYHGLRELGVSTWLDYKALAQTLAQDRDVVGIQYCVGVVRGNRQQAEAQKKFLKFLEDQDVEVFRGKLKRNSLSPMAVPMLSEIRGILAEFEVSPPSARRQLEELSKRRTHFFVEKGVDVQIAVAMLAGAFRDLYDVAYLLSADADFVPAIKQVQDLGKRVFVATPQPATEIRATANVVIKLDADWFRRNR